MSGEFYFNANGAIHDGGTKYYQVIRIDTVAGSGVRKSVLVTHYGKAHPGAPSEPKYHGSCKFDLFHTGGEAAAAGRKIIATKTRRGYSEWRSNAKIHINDALHLGHVLKEWFKPEQALMIMEHLSAKAETSVASLDSTTSDESDGIGELGKAALVNASESKEEWGTW